MNFKLIMLFFFLPTVISAQSLSYQTISVENGLPGNEIHGIIQDSKGYIWIGTKNGLCRWDSKNFETFTIADGLPNNEVLSLYEDTKGRIWISSFSQELCYYFDGNIYNKKSISFLNKIKSRPGSKLTEQNNELYYNSMDDNITRFNLLTQKKITYYARYQVAFSRHNGKIWGVEEKKDDNSLIVKDAKQYIFSEDSSYYVPYYLYPNIPEIAIVTKMDFRHKFYSFQYGMDTPFYKAKYMDEGFHFALYNKGKVLEVYKDRITQTVNNYTIKVERLNRSTPFSIGGIIYMPVSDGLLFCRQIPILDYDQNPEINNNARFILKYKGEVYTLNNEYQLINVSRQKQVNQLNGNAINLYNLLYCDNNFYVTTSFYAYYFTDPNKAINNSKSMGKYNFKYISPSKKEGYFFAANGIVGIALLNFQKKISYDLLKDPQKSVYSVYEDRGGRLWYSTADKVYYTYDYYGGVKNSREFVLDASSPLFCKSVSEDNKGNLFFTTNGGVFVYDGKKKYRVDQTNLLTDNECNKVVIDTLRHSFWVATKNGLNHIGYSREKDGLKFRVLSKFFASDGLRSDNINDLLLDSNKLYIATDKGANILDDVGYRPDTMEIPVYIKLSAINAVAGKRYDTVKTIALKHDQNNLTIGFSALYFLRRDRLQVKAYLYRNGSLVSKSEIEGDKIDYYSLNDGDYKLVLYAFDRDYPYINGKSSPFAFTINSPYYKTWWFIIGSSLLVIVVSTGLLLWNLNRRKKRAIRQAELQAKLNESTLKSLQSQMNPHFVFNSLNTIQSFITEKNEEGAIDYLSDFSGLMREILEQSVHTFISLENEIQFLRQYLQLEVTRYKGSFEVDWDIRLGEDDLTDIYIPTMLIQPIVENAVKHGVSSLNEAKGHIGVSFSLVHENLLKVVVKDNGRPVQGKKFKGNSIAVKTIRERLGIYTKNRIKGEYHLEVSETGATATITIPI